MEEKKLTDEEIVKALDICYSAPCCTSECPYFNKYGRNFCVEDKALYKDMKRIVEEHIKQKAEIERLTEENRQLVKIGNGFALERNNLREELDELKAKQVVECHGMLEGCDMVKQAVKDTAKEIFTDLLKEFSIRKSFGNADVVVIEMASRKGVEVE